MQSKPQGAPKRHHYIPEFLLKSWTGADDKLLRYHRNWSGDVVSKRASPRSVCFRDSLYEITGTEDEEEQAMEQLFMGPIDNDAAAAHQRLIGDDAGNLTDEERIAWARFILSLLFRTAADVDHLWTALEALANPAVSRAILKIDAPEELPRDVLKALQMEALREMIEDRERWIALLEMEWAVIDVGAAYELRISDWPLLLSDDAPWLGSSCSFVALPISPSRIFVAAGSRDVLHGFARKPERELALEMNLSVVGRALNFVGASRPDGATFVTRNLGSLTRPSLVAGLANKYRSAAGKP